MTRSRLARRLGGFLLAVLAVTGTSCGDGRPPCYPVRGTVTVDGKPVPNVMVILYPAAPVPGHEVNPYAETDATGAFEVSSYSQRDGAPAGEYVVAFDWPVMGGVLGNRADGPDRLGGQYSKAKAAFKLTVEKGAVTPPVYQLKTDPKVMERIKNKKPTFGGS